MSRNGLAVLFIVIMLSACTVPQQSPLGVNANKTEKNSTISFYRNHEGPLTDLMVPDQSPMGTGQRIDDILNHTHSATRKNLGMKHEGINHQGARIYTNRPGTIRDKYAHRRSDSKKRLKTDQSNIVIQSQSLKENEIEKIVEKLQIVRDAHVISNENTFVVGVESDETDRNHLVNQVRKELDSFKEEEIHVTTNRKIINRIKALEHNVSLAEPFDTFGAALAEIVDLIDDATHHHR
ncbi:YhcN/YlaJ family sporulation lipoprotein [Halalkalibacter sp. APA_J-10(15)]|uniref:YhcN/YlaJ family sporulation lipoprotein n=1 Tax=Halalkalibacter sp. APA_J-10(15) TaxID=2933805 RepID=UPI001FF304A8|nr:YhcN/YlaJ family sporulation lipoprotein [Halalkalibacter sp. APA_J-10(15)]MCK0472039.1 YhcN/YlaJ family sporulation lipoprotein [Halalkalibacter sp. APA_J-10(15)]